MNKSDKNFLIWLLKNISLTHNEWKDEIEAIKKKLIDDGGIQANCLKLAHIDSEHTLNTLDLTFLIK